MSRGDFLLAAITCDPAPTRAADQAGVDRIGIDIERPGKASRQQHVPNASVSPRLDDLAIVAADVTRAAIFVRLNPLHEGTRGEVDRAVAMGARVLVLPFFTTAREAAAFVGIGERAAPVLLLETALGAAAGRGTSGQTRRTGESRPDVDSRAPASFLHYFDHPFSRRAS